MSPEDFVKELQAAPEPATPEQHVQLGMKVICRLLVEFEAELKRMVVRIPAPVPEDLEEMASGKRAFSLAALLMADLWQALLLIEEAGIILEVAAGYGPREGQRRRRQGWGIDSPAKAAAQIRAALAETQVRSASPGVQ